MAKKEMTIEKAFTDIEEIIEKMEDDDITLDESMKLYNDGVKLLKYCNDTLDRTEKELIVLKEEDAADVEMINSSGADIVWIGLGAPKQEKWMCDHKDRVKGVMMGVGAGFDFHAGTIRRAPKWIQRIGFEWLYRLFQDPKRLIGRYFVTNAKYIWYTFLERFH